MTNESPSKGGRHATSPGKAGAQSRRDEYRIASLIETAIDHLDRAVDAREAEVGINALKAAVQVSQQAAAAGISPEQAEYLQIQFNEARLVFECRGWA